MFETRLFGEPCSQLFLDLLVRYRISAVDVIDTLLNGCHKLDSINNLIE